jgi:hypothetical protein
MRAPAVERAPHVAGAVRPGIGPTRFALLEEQTPPASPTSCRSAPAG